MRMLYYTCLLDKVQLAYVSQVQICNLINSPVDEIAEMLQIVIIFTRLFLTEMTVETMFVFIYLRE